MNSVVKLVGEGTAWMSFSTFFVKVISIAHSVVVLWYLSVFEYGLVELALSIPLLLGLFNLAGLEPVMVADLVNLRKSKNYGEAGKMLASYTKLRAFLSVASSIVLAVLALFFMESFSEQVRQMVILLSLIFLFSPLRSLVLIACNVFHRFRSLSLLTFFTELLKLSLVFLFLSVYELGPVGVIMAYVISEIILSVIYVPIVVELFKVFSGYIQWSSSLLYVLRNHAKWSVFHSGVHSFGQNIRPWIIQYFLGVPAVGIYGLAVGMLQHVSSMFPLWRVVTPILPNYLNEKLKLIKLINSTIKYQIVILLLNSIAAIIFIPILINTFFPDYESAYPLFLLLLFSLLPGSFSRVFTSVFHTLKLQKNLFTSSVFLFFMTLVILPVSVMTFGLYGIAVEYFISVAIYAIGRYRVLKKHIEGYSFSIKGLFTFGQTDKIVWQRMTRRLFYRLGIGVKSN